MSLGEMSMPLSATRKSQRRNADESERSKIWETCFVSCESVKETRARQLQRGARFEYPVLWEDEW